MKLTSRTLWELYLAGDYQATRALEAFVNGAIVRSNQLGEIIIYHKSTPQECTFNHDRRPHAFCECKHYTQVIKLPKVGV